MVMRKCSTCKETKPLEEYHWQNKAKGTRQYVCKSCRVTKTPVWTEAGRVCKDCKEFKTLDDYYISQGIPLTRCKSCWTNYRKTYGETREVVNSGFRVCKKCNQSRSMLDFYKNAHASGGRGWVCKFCSRSQASLSKWGI